MTLFAPAFVERSFWLDGVELPVAVPEAPPATADVVIIGGGYTGLSAAATTAAAGASTVVLERGDLGAGCSALNGGQVSTSIKPAVGRLRARFGDAVAKAIHGEGIQALERLRELVTSAALECDWQPVGRFVGATSPRHFEQLLALREVQQRELGIPCEIVTRQEQHRELGTDVYYGGLVYPRHAAVQPARLLRELHRLALQAGSRYHAQTPALAIDREGGGLRVRTPRGDIAARHVIIATNGYTGRFSPWHRRRIIPIASQIIATEPLAPALMRELMPMRRVVSDTRRVIVYYRASPDGTRVLFGGRSTVFNAPAAVYAPRLMGWMRRIFPQLGGARITHAWAGTVAFTFDTMPHIGEHDGVHYCMGYCGSGVSLSTWFGHKVGLKVLGRPAGRTALDGVPFQTRPLYNGHPWFLSPSILAYRTLDALKL